MERPGFTFPSTEGFAEQYATASMLVRQGEYVSAQTTFLGLTELPLNPVENSKTLQGLVNVDLQQAKTPGAGNALEFLKSAYNRLQVLDSTADLVPNSIRAKSATYWGNLTLALVEYIDDPEAKKSLLMEGLRKESMVKKKKLSNANYAALSARFNEMRISLTDQLLKFDLDSTEREMVYSQRLNAATAILQNVDPNRIGLNLIAGEAALELSRLSDNVTKSRLFLEEALRNFQFFADSREKRGLPVPDRVRFAIQDVQAELSSTE